MTDLELMKEYNMSSIAQLERALKQLIDANFFDESELAARFPYIINVSKRGQVLSH